MFEATIQAVRDSLASAIADTFMISTFVVLGCVVVALFMKEIPLRKVHFVSEEGGAPAASGDEPAPATVASAPADVTISDAAAGAPARGQGAPAVSLAPVAPAALAVALAVGLAALLAVAWRWLTPGSGPSGPS
jgi:hypothetical protein